MFLKKNGESEQHDAHLIQLPQGKQTPSPLYPVPFPRISTIVQPQTLKFFGKIPGYIPSQNYVITKKMNICTFHLKWKVSVLEGDIEIYKMKRKNICKCKLHWVFFVKMPKNFEPIFAIFSVMRSLRKYYAIYVHTTICTYCKLIN